MKSGSITVATLTVGAAFVGSGLDIPYLTPAAGMVGIFGIPFYIVLTTTDWRSAYWRERVVLSIGAAIMLVLAVGLLADFALPLMGVGRPLDRAPTLCCCGVAWVLLWWRRHRQWKPVLPILRAVTVTRPDVTVLALSMAALVTAIVGAVRLNNGDGSTAAAFALGLILTAFVAGLVIRQRLEAGTTAVIVYITSLALLFQTSLRGWFVTGHDIQHEYYVFQRTATAGRWGFANVHDPYNACLSITILPTMVLRFTGVDGPYVYKVCFQVLFAFSGVIAYSIASRVLSRGLALVATIFFVGFPTFFTDMPFLNRQEIAFLLTGCCFLLFLMDELPLHRRRTWMATLVSATIVTHYSTSYLLFGALSVAKLLEVAVRYRRRRDRVRVPRSPVSIAMLALTALLGLGWGSGSAQSNRHLGDTLSAVVSALGGAGGSERASSTAYSLTGGASVSPSRLLRNYVNATLPSGSGRPAAVRVSLAYPAKVTPVADLPTTDLGHKLDEVGINVRVLNTALRSVAARLLQILVLAGLIGCLVLGRYRTKMPPDFYYLALGSVVGVGAQIVLPDISVDYGLLRAFQQALLVLAPFVTIGSVALAGVVFRRLAALATGALSLLLLTSLTGLLPQELGGYPAQLTLNNSGEYYDLYYSSPQEVAAARWLASHAPSGSTLHSDTFTAEVLSNYTNMFYGGDIYPTLLMQRGPFVFLGYSEVRLHQATITPNGDFVTYTYPISYLDTTHNLVYAGPDDRIYQ